MWKGVGRNTCNFDVDIRLGSALHGAVEGDGPGDGEQVHAVLRGVLGGEQRLPVLLEPLEALSLVSLVARRRHWLVYVNLLLSVAPPVFSFLFLQLLVASRQSVCSLESLISIGGPSLLAVLANSQGEG